MRLHPVSGDLLNYVFIYTCARFIFVVVPQNSMIIRSFDLVQQITMLIHCIPNHCLMTIRIELHGYNVNERNNH